MGLLQTIQEQAAGRRLEFLVIGGLAVNCHGASRETAGLDLLIRRDARGSWLELFARLAYTVEGEADAFIQLAPPQSGAWPADLMLVSDPTFRLMLHSAVEVEMYDARVFIPSLEHLFALKLHVLKRAPCSPSPEGFSRCGESGASQPSGLVNGQGSRTLPEIRHFGA